MPAKPRFTDISAHLREAIVSGHFAVGSTLPTELELCAHYQTSRHTVRAALQALQQLGLVSRRKNAGTRVESATPTVGFRHALASVSDLVQFGATHSRAVQKVDTVTANMSLATLLDCAPGSKWLRFSSLRFEEGPGTAQTAIGWTEVFVLPEFLGLEQRVRASPHVLISSLLESFYGQHIAAVTQDVCAVPLPSTVAQALGAQPDSPGLKIVRRYTNVAGQLIEASVTHHVAERFSIRTTLTRG